MIRPREGPQRRSTVMVHTQRSAVTGVTAVLLLVALHAAAAAATAVEDSIRALETKRAQVLLAADTTALSRMTADEFVEISRLGQLRRKVDNIHDIGSGELKLTSVKYDSLTVRVYGDVAILQGIADNTGTFRGYPFAGKIRYTRVF